MTHPRRSTGLRVERAVRVLPDIDIIVPLRALVVATSRQPIAEPSQLTVGKRSVSPERLQELIPEAVSRFSAHLSDVYALAVTALSAEASGDITGAVRALLRVSALEVSQGREAMATAWAEHALELAESAPDRSAEVESLLVVAELEQTRGALERAARSAQRAFAIAEAARAHDAAASACLMLGQVFLEQDIAQGAEAWFSRGLSFVNGNAVLRARLELALGEFLARQGEHVGAGEKIQSAEEVFRKAEESASVAAALAARARIASSVGSSDDALVLFREALATVQRSARAARDARGELAVRLRFCHYLLGQGQLRDAEDEARRAEEVAIAHNLTRELARVYLVLGEIRTAQHDESGLVFFEKAIELSQGPVPALRLEADAYHAYGNFCTALGLADDAAAYFERERELRALAVAGTAV